MASGDGMLRLWETANGAEVLSIRLEESFLGFSWCTFSKDGHHIWAGLDEKDQLWGWDATPMDEAKTP